MEPSPTGEGNGCSAIQELTKFLWNSKVLYRFKKEPATGFYPEPDESNPYVHLFPIRFILILTSFITSVSS
jgi:hypothetical protein